MIKGFLLLFSKKKAFLPLALPRGSHRRSAAPGAIATPTRLRATLLAACR
jgi:hypothetical protein